MIKKATLYFCKGPIVLYRKVISPFLRPSCRFYPTCSSYALEALERHGIFKGTALTFKRFFRCHPWYCGQFHDPVPKQFTWGAVIGYNRSANNNDRPECCGLHEKVRQNEDV